MVTKCRLFLPSLVPTSGSKLSATSGPEFGIHFWYHAGYQLSVPPVGLQAYTKEQVPNSVRISRTKSGSHFWHQEGTHFWHQVRYPILAPKWYRFLAPAFAQIPGQNLGKFCTPNRFFFLGRQSGLGHHISKPDFCWVSSCSGSCHDWFD